MANDETPTLPLDIAKGAISADGHRRWLAAAALAEFDLAGDTLAVHERTDSALAAFVPDQDR